MIRITMELVPMGYEEFKSAIGEVILYRTLECDQTQHTHNYNTSIRLQGRDNTTFRSRVEGFDNRRDILELLELVLKNRVKAEQIEERIENAFVHCKRTK